MYGNTILFWFSYVLLINKYKYDQTKQRTRDGATKNYPWDRSLTSFIREGFSSMDTS